MSKIAALEREFEDFLRFNQKSRLEILGSNKADQETSAPDDAVVIREPWGDATLQIEVPEDAGERRELCQSLNQLYLPNRYSAVLHRDTQVLEVIWTAFKLKKSSQEVADRAFNINFLGSIRRCNFGRSTDRLLSLAKHCVPCTIPNSTEHRNIVTLHFFANKLDLPNVDVPYSFFAECGGLSEEDLFEFVKHLNAYMYYYDHQTPRILIHEEAAPSAHPTRSRYLNGSFPKTINARKLDDNLLAYWLEMAATRNEILRYLLCYRIIEYASFNYVEPAMRSKIKRLLLAPDAGENLDRLVDTIAEISAISKGIDEIPRQQNLVANAVDLQLIWAEISRCDDYFFKGVKFDGGFEVKPLCTKGETFEVFSNNGVRSTLDRLRSIRNALAHGQDTQTRATIRPTARNSALIRPWLNIIEIIAGEAMLYRDVV